jgi:cell division septation protein DedD
MNGIVPEKDALGFLDLLLYGSSLSVITQKTSGGVRVIGAGSFPVTKKMPFVLQAFEEAARRLVNHSRCVIFSGPLREDEDEVHSLVGAVDIPIFVRTSDRDDAGTVLPLEEKIASQWGKEVLSVRISTSGVTTTAAEIIAEKPEQEDIEVFEELRAPRTVASSETQRVQVPTPPLAHEITPKEEKLEQDDELLELPYERERDSSRVPHIAAGIIVVIIIVFVVWWLRREVPEERVQSVVSEEVATSPVESGADEPEQESAVDQGATVAEQISEAEPSEETAQVPPPASDDAVPTEEIVTDVEPTATDSPGVIDSEDILVMDDLKHRWAGYYLIHISSFRGSEKARNEAAYLKSKGFPAFIVYMDLESKGSWYRVYVGPLETREDARGMKKELDVTPQVRFTRITSTSRG